MCGDACVDDQRNPLHCGGCGLACESGEVCVGGSCELSCPSGLEPAQGTCLDLSTDRRHCGAVGNACDPGEVCVDGGCDLTCQSGLTEVDGACVNLGNDLAHCGAPNNACDPGEVCSAGSCETTCHESLAVCDERCVDTATDPRHCGGCGAPCEGSLACWGGECVDPCLGFPTTSGEPLFELTLITPNDSIARIHHTYLVVEALRELGIHALARPEDFFEVIVRLFVEPEAGPAGFDLGFIGWGLTPIPALDLFGCDTDLNFAGWCSEAFDTHAETYFTSLDPEVRAEALRTAQEIFVEELPNSVLYATKAVTPLADELSGYDYVFGYARPETWSGLSDVVVAVPFGPDQFNPAIPGGIFSHLVNEPMFEWLFVHDAGLDSETRGHFMGGLAVSVPELVAVDSGFTATVDLRASEFSDGHAVDAYDVAFTFQVVLALGGDGFHPDWLDFGFTEETVEVVDADTLVFHFGDPRPEWVFELNVPVLPMHYWVPHDDDPTDAAAEYADLFAGNGAYDGPVPASDDAFSTGEDTFGSGPYRAHDDGLFDEEMSAWRLVRHPGSGTAANDVESIDFRVLSSDAVLAELEAGTVHIADALFRFFPDEIDPIDGVSAFVQDILGMQVMAYNFDSAVLAELEVRQAIDHVLPRERMVQEAARGLGRIVSSFVPFAAPTFDPDFGEGGALAPVHDIAAARQLMRDAGYTDLLADAPVLMTRQALLCNADRTLQGWVADELIDQATADRLLSDLARAPIGE